MKREEELTVSVKNLTRPIIGIENITALEAFDIMVARIEGALAYPNSSPLLPNPKSEAEPVAWTNESGWRLLTEEKTSCLIWPNHRRADGDIPLYAHPKPEATEGGAHGKGLIAPRAGSFGVDWHEQWLKMRKSYHTLKHAAARVVAETDSVHDNEPWPIKYRAPYEAITVLRATLTAKPDTDGRGE